MYVKVSDRTDENREKALLWLFLIEKGQVKEFTEFCRQRRGLDLGEIEEQLRRRISESSTSPGQETDSTITNNIN